MGCHSSDNMYFFAFADKTPNARTDSGTFKYISARTRKTLHGSADFFGKNI